MKICHMKTQCVKRSEVASSHNHHPHNRKDNKAALGTLALCWAGPEAWKRSFMLVLVVLIQRAGSSPDVFLRITFRGNHGQLSDTEWTSSHHHPDRVLSHLKSMMPIEECLLGCVCMCGVWGESGAVSYPIGDRIIGCTYIPSAIYLSGAILYFFLILPQHISFYLTHI